MMKKLLTYTILTVMMFLYGLTSLGGAVVSAWNADDPFVLIPEAESEERVTKVKELQEIKKDKDFWTDFNTAGDDFAWDKDIGSQMASWIITRDTILLLVVRIVKFVSNAALVVGSLMVIYAWYLYVMSAIAWDQTSQANEAIKDAIIGIVVVIFSYAIQKFVIEAFLA